MKLQFYRLIAVLILSCALVIWSFSQLVAELYPETDSYNISVAALLQSPDAMPTKQVVPRQQLALPPSLSAMLDKGHIIALSDENAQLYYYKTTPEPGLLLQLGPLTDYTERNELMPVLLLAFYGSLTLIALLLIWPVFRDLRRLQQIALQFGQQPRHISIPIRRTAVIYPLANAFKLVANQIIDLVEMHKSLSKTISHEVRTPLARMRFALELSEHQIPPQYRDRLNADLDEIEQLATNYLNFAKLEYLRQDKAFAPVSLPAFCAQLQQRFDIYQQQLAIDIHYEGEQACFDKAALLIAAQNLISNAMRFAKSRICVSLRGDLRHWQLTVEDDGPGFSQTDPQILQAFTRQQQDEQGFGLGLYIVQQIARWHQASIEVGLSNNLGGAAVFIHSATAPERPSDTP